MLLSLPTWDFLCNSLSHIVYTTLFKVERSYLSVVSSHWLPLTSRDKFHSRRTLESSSVGSFFSKSFLSRACVAVFYKMEHKRLKQQSFHDSPPAQSRFSTLPVELRRKILDYFSFEDVARTSILSIIFSSTSNWSELSKVILDKLLFEKRGRWIAHHPSAWVDKVNEILINHREGLIPIQKFVLHIPDMQYKWGLYINIWLSYLSSNSIKELSVDNCNIITYKISSILFEWSELTRLMLRNCAFYESFGSFQNLRFLRLEKIAFGSVKVGDVTLSTPSLVWAELIDCMGFRYLDIQAPELANVFVATSVRMSHDDEKHMWLKLAKPTIHFFIDRDYSGRIFFPSSY